MALSPGLIARLHQRARADRWGISVADFAAVLDRSAAKLGTDETDLDRALSALHLDDLALACACERGLEGAWEHFVRDFRPTLYRAATAMAGEHGRELADSLYADLFGLQERDGARQSLFRYFHGRSSLATWLRAVLAQRHVDGVRAARRFDPLPEDEDVPAVRGAAVVPGDETAAQASRVREALSSAIARLSPKDRLRLGWYYAQDMTLAQIGRLSGEHEATVSRHLSRIRKALRADVEAGLRAAGCGPGEIDECFAAAAADPGDARLADLIGEGDETRKIATGPRSQVEERP
jgi:RNA polymerase sigma-70 factor (ECF subfamily)